MEARSASDPIVPSFIDGVHAILDALACDFATTVLVSSIERHSAALHENNRRQWRLEDLSRTRGVSSSKIAESKTAIDRSNLRRHALIANINGLVDAALELRSPSRSGTTDAGPRNTEAVGAALDRLSVLHLRRGAFSDRQAEAELVDRRISVLSRTLTVMIRELCTGGDVHHSFPEQKRYGESQEMRTKDRAASGRFQGLLSDMDGVLAGTERLKGLAHEMTVSTLGASADRALYRDVMGHSFSHVATYFTARAGIELDLADYTARFKEVYRNLLSDTVDAMPGAVELIARLRDVMPMAVVSSSDRWMIDLVLEKIGLAGAFSAIVSAEDVTKEKPDPEPYLVAADRLRIPPERCVVLEDTSVGVIAGKSAGCSAIATYHEFNLHHDFSMADLVVESLNEEDELARFILAPSTDAGV